MSFGMDTIWMQLIKYSHFSKFAIGRSGCQDTSIFSETNTPDARQRQAARALVISADSFARRRIRSIFYLKLSKDVWCNIAFFA